MPGSRASRKAERAKEILAAAFDEFVLRGYAAARLEAVAERIGITKGTIYFYFGSKEKVFEAAIKTAAATHLMAIGQELPAWTGDLADDLRAFLAAIYRFIGDNPRSHEALRLLVAEANRFPKLVEAYFGQFMDQVAERLALRLAEAVAAGELRSDLTYLPHVVLAPPLAHLVMGLLFAERRVVDGELFFRTHIELLLTGLAPIDARVGASVEGPAWTEWRPVPDACRGGLVTAPIGPGLYELRLASGEAILVGGAGRVAGRLAALLAPGGRRDPRRDFLARHLDMLQYRTAACADEAEARALIRRIDRRAYRFGALRRGAGTREVVVESSAYVSALAALAGSAIGAFSSFATTWLTQNSTRRLERTDKDRIRREALYIAFIDEASGLFADAVGHEIRDPAQLVKLYSLISRMRLFASPETIRTAEEAAGEILATYVSPNRSIEELKRSTFQTMDPLRAFSETCRRELASL